jgi:hypothetical protein
LYKANQANKAESQISRFSIKDTVKNIFSYLTIQNVANGKIDIVIDHCVPEEVAGDLDRIELVLSNMLKFAYIANTEDKKSISVQINLNQID